MPDNPGHAIDDMDDLISVATRGRYSRGEDSKAVFINSATNTQVGEIPTHTAIQIMSEAARHGLLKIGFITDPGTDAAATPLRSSSCPPPNRPLTPI